MELSPRIVKVINVKYKKSSDLNICFNIHILIEWAEIYIYEKYSIYFKSKKVDVKGNEWYL